MPLDSRTFSTILNKVTAVSETAIEAKIKNRLSDENLEALITATDEDFAPFLKRYCNKTGRHLFTIPVEDLQRLVAIHGREKALMLLQANAFSNYAPEWLCTDAEALNNLSVYDPVGYFIYSAGVCFHWQPAPYVPSYGHSAPATNTIFDDAKTFDRMFPDTFHSETFKAEYNNAVFPRICDGQNRHYQQLADKASAYTVLRAMWENGEIEESYLVEINELFRRLLGLVKPHKDPKFLTKFSNRWIVETVFSSDSLHLFKNELKEKIASLFSDKYQNKLPKGHKKRSRFLSNADISDIRLKYEGFEAFRGQIAVKAKGNRSDLIRADLQHFFTPNLDDTQIALLCQQGKNAKTTEELKGNKPFKVSAKSEKSEQLKGGFKLNFKK